MKTFDVKVQKRTELGKKSTKALRKDDNIPCVMYGGEETIQFYAPANDFRKLIYTDQVLLVELDIEGKKHKATMKEIQFHPVTDQVLHIDFIEVFEDKPAVVELPVKLEGNSVGIIAGGKLRLKKRYLKVKGLVKDMPENLVIDIAELNIGSVLKVMDLNFDNLELLDPAQAMVVGVVTSRLAKSGEEDEAGEGEAEGEGDGEASTEEAAE